MCTQPLRAYQPVPGVQPVLSPNQWIFGDPRYIKLPCGQCHACRIKRSRDWAVRCVHEASLWELNCFVTLTYDNDHLQYAIDKTGLRHATLYRRDFTLFMKRLRKRFGEKIRYFMCGEYGSRFKRPHYHVCLFNFDFIDKELFQIKNGIKLYRSKDLESLWYGGFSTVGELTYDSAAYTARYIVKKITGDLAIEHYGVRTPEFTCCSRRPGIADGFIKKYLTDVYPKDYTTLKGRKFRPPRFYDKKLQDINPDLLLKLKTERREKNIDYDCRRLSVINEKLIIDYNRLNRPLDNDKLEQIYD